MNNLNSVLIEGVLDGDPVITDGVCHMRMVSERSFYDSDDRENLFKEVSYFNIEVPGKLGNCCKKLGFNGRGFRVVGRLKQEEQVIDGKDQSRYVIVAEHVEFRPEKRETIKDECGGGEE
jgi:single-strand DNA-binding protein